MSRTTIKLFEYQKEAIEKLRSGSILCGVVGSGKSLTSLFYYHTKICGGDDIDLSLKVNTPVDLYIITTARKRDTLEWDKECIPFGLIKNNIGRDGILLTIDSWNNIDKYINIKDAFFIFDEQRVIGSGLWVKSFIKITKNNRWILLSGTPGDTWSDYIPVFVANGYYKNRTEFFRSHVIFSPYVQYPKIERYIDTWKLIEHKRNTLVYMDYKRNSKKQHIEVLVDYDKDVYATAEEKRWNIYKESPIVNSAEYGYVLRRIVNSDPSRLKAIINIIKNNKSRVIIFYNFNYELDILRTIDLDDYIVAEWNGKKHEQIPKSEKWIYLVQYTAGAEGWNCIETDTIIFYSKNHSYRMSHQAEGRIDRLNTPYKILYYYHLYSNSWIDKEITRSLSKKEDFNINKYYK